MDPQLWAWVRWLLAALGLVLVVAMTLPAAIWAITNSIEFSSDGGRDPAEVAPAGGATAAAVPVTDGSAPPIADFVVDGGTVTDSEESELALSDESESAVVLAFPVIPGTPSCIGGVFIELTILQATPTELGSFGATAYDADRLVDGVSLPTDLLIGDEPSSRAYTKGDPGRLRWDVTSVYRDFLASGQAPVGAPFVAAVTVTATRSEEPDAGVRFAASESRRAKPALTWTGVRGCGAA